MQAREVRERRLGLKGRGEKPKNEATEPPKDRGLSSCFHFDNIGFRQQHGRPFDGKNPAAPRPSRRQP
jgi:hypothetical protein